jgi:putative serine protease PepD
MPDSPAAAAGLVKDDVVVRIGDASIESMTSLVVALRHHDPGDSVEVTYMRSGEPQTATVELAERPSGP